MGKSGRLVIEALISGETNPEVLAALDCGSRLKAKTIPGVSDTVAHVIIAEVGLDMRRFLTSGHLIS